VSTGPDPSERVYVAVESVTALLLMTNELPGKGPLGVTRLGSSGHVSGWELTVPDTSYAVGGVHCTLSAVAVPVPLEAQMSGGQLVRNEGG